MTDQEILAIIAQGIIDGTDLDCTAETQAREVLRQLRAAGVIAGAVKRPLGAELTATQFVAGLMNDDNVRGFLSQRICCDGHHCGCRGADVGSYLEWIARPLPAELEAPQCPQ